MSTSDWITVVLGLSGLTVAILAVLFQAACATSEQRHTVKAWVSWAFEQGIAYGAVGLVLAGGFIGIFYDDKPAAAPGWVSFARQLPFIVMFLVIVRAAYIIFKEWKASKSN
jgi:hypothetical protein